MSTSASSGTQLLLIATLVLVISVNTALSSSPTGLRNLGNTCYLNSQLQCQYHIPLIRNLIIRGSNKHNALNGNTDDCDDDNDSSGLRSVFESMENSRGTSASSSVSTYTLCRKLGINVYEQQDAQEFWKLLLNGKYLPDRAADLYQGAYEDYIIAQDGSSREKRREEAFLDLSLDVQGRSSVLPAMSEMFGSPELLQKIEGNGWRPEKGAEPVDALKGSSLRVQGLPSILQLHLKRFNYDWHTDSMSKINDRFEFSEVLDCSGICADIEEDEKHLAVFDLQSVVVHMGQYGSGHYYCYVRPDIRRPLWYRIDDEQVTKVTFSDVICDAYGGLARITQRRKRRFLARLFGFRSGQTFGYGGRASSAYMLQYVKRSDIPILYNQE
mmetsp:Transcript_29052/g.45146  ORF Transcript_29052/g.45146 Transcript_29052/m.45146 type:complete len:384 (+) Transcript_29052:34-1185(+)